jgi:hypothetical protein
MTDNWTPNRRTCSASVMATSVSSRRTFRTWGLRAEDASRRARREANTQGSQPHFLSGTLQFRAKFSAENLLPKFSGREEVGSGLG